MNSYIEKAFTPKQQVIRARALEEVLSNLTSENVLRDGFELKATETSFRMDARILINVSHSQAYRIITGED